METCSVRQVRRYARTCESVLRLAVCLVLELLAGLTQAADWIPPAAGLQPGPRAQCGPRSLYAAARLLGKDVQYQEVLEDCQLTEDGCNLASLREAAERAGLSAFPVSASRSSLCSLLRGSDRPLVAICHQKRRDGDDHFVVWFWHANGNYCLMDWFNPANPTMTEKGLTDYTGAALLLSSSPLDENIISESIAAQSRRQFPVWLTWGGCLVVGVVLGWFINRNPEVASRKPATKA